MSEASSAQRNRRLSQRRQPKVRVKLACRKGGLDLGLNIATALLDVSESGARLLLKEGLAAGNEVSVSLEGPNHRRPVLRLGHVVWCVPAADGAYCVGVNFQKSLPYKDLYYLTSI
jgi:hypothetical protein